MLGGHYRGYGGGAGWLGHRYANLTAHAAPQDVPMKGDHCSRWGVVPCMAKELSLQVAALEREWPSAPECVIVSQPPLSCRDDRRVLRCVPTRAATVHPRSIIGPEVTEHRLTHVHGPASIHQ